MKSMTKKVFEKTISSDIEPLQSWPGKIDEDEKEKISEAVKKWQETMKKVRDATEEEKASAMKIMKMSPEQFSLMDVYLTAGGKIAVRTPESAWMSLCGREWHIDMGKGTYECVALN